MHIVTVLNNKKLREMATFSIESNFSVKVTEAASVAEALEPILRGVQVDLIICEHPINSEPIFKLLVALGKTIPIILYSPNPETKTQAAGVKIIGVLNDTDFIAQLIKLLTENKVATSATPSETNDDSRYCRINVDLLRGQKQLLSDVSIRLSSTKYLKIFSKGDSFDAQDRQKYIIEKKIEYLYVLKENVAEYLNKFKEDLQVLLSQENIEGDGAKIAAVFETTQDLVQRLGPTPEVQTVIKTNIMVSVKVMGKNPKLKNILAKLVVDKKSYISSHSMYLAQVACAIASTMEWESEMTYQKLSMASFLHDITLTDQKIAQLQTRDDISKNNANFSKDELRAYVLHPVKAAELARQFSELPPDTDNIIIQHHEQPDGSGFPRGLNSKQVAPLSAVFNIAHDIIDWIYQRPTQFQIEAFLEATKDKYSTGNYRKVFQSMKALKL